MTASPDTPLLTGQTLRQIRSGDILVTPSGGSQTTLGAALAATGSGTVTSIVGGAGLSGGTITTAGTLAVTAATTAALGGIIVGSGLTVASGTLSASGGS